MVLKVLANVVEVSNSWLALSNSLIRGLCCLVDMVKLTLIIVVDTSVALRGMLHFPGRIKGKC